MSRIRTIKPEFWANEKLGEMKAEYQLLFIGLWNLADRRGFLEDRPKRIKAQIFPYREIDIETALIALEGDFIKRVIIENVPYIQVINFSKHQHCNIKEPESKIPKQYWNDADTIQAPYEHHTDTQGREGKGKEGKGREGEGEGNAREHVNQPTPSPLNKILSFQETMDQIYSDSEWVNLLKSEFSLSDSQLAIGLKKFFNESKLDNKYPRVLIDTKRHFINSLKKGMYRIVETEDCITTDWNPPKGDQQ